MGRSIKFIFCLAVGRSAFGYNVWCVKLALRGLPQKPIPLMISSNHHPQLYQRRTLRIAALLLMLSSPVWMLLLFYTPSFPLGAGMVLLPAFAALTALTLRQLTQGDAFERKVVLGGLAFKLCAAGMYNAMVAFVYNGRADCLTYYRIGVDWAANFQMLGTDAILYPYWGTSFITMLAGALIYFVPSDAAVAGTFALISYWGQYFVYRAFRIALPEGDPYEMALLAFLLPSLSFWSATVGKEAVILLGIGLCAYGYARASARANPVGYLIAGIGLAIVGLVRPHVAAMLVLAIACSVSFSSSKRGIAGMLNKFIGIPLIFAVTIYSFGQAQAFFGVTGLSSGVTTVEHVQADTLAGGSRFSGSLTLRILLAPFLLFRPFPWEINSAVAALASLECLALGVLFWRRRRNLWYAVQNWRDPFIIFIVAFSLQFAVSFSAAISNFGILTRERVMLLPIAVMLVCLPRARRKTVNARTGGWRSRLGGRAGLPKVPVLSPSSSGGVGPPLPISRV
jgi:hypothetical protein